MRHGYVLHNVTETQRVSKPNEVEDSFDTVDGRNPAPVDMGKSTIVYREILHARWLFGISSINCIILPIYPIGLRLKSAPPVKRGEFAGRSILRGAWG